MLRNRTRLPLEQTSPTPGPLSSQAPTTQPTGSQPLQRRGLFLPLWAVNLVPALLIVGLALELWGPANIKPSVIFGGFWGNATATKIKTELAASQAQLAMQNEENGRLQKQLVLYQAQNERLTGAYQAVFQRNTALMQAVAQSQQVITELQANAAKESQEGNITGAQIGSFVAGLGLLLGNKELAAGGLEASRAFANEASNNINHQILQSAQTGVAVANTWHEGSQDTATIDSMVAGTADNPPPPADHAPPPAPPTTYQQQPTAKPASVEAPAGSLPTLQASPNFLLGAKDRHAWEAWFAGLTGDAKAGAVFWADKRNDPKWRGRASCAVGERGPISDDFRTTCEKAKAFLATVDTNRATWITRADGIASSRRQLFYPVLRTRP